MKTTNDGIVAFHVSVRVSFDEIRTWEPERIRMFFHGMALARMATEGIKPKPEAEEPKP